MWKAVLCVILLLLQTSYADDDDQPKQTIVGTGSGFAYIVHRAWSLTYSQQYPDISISYIPNENIFQNVTSTIVLPNFGATELPLSNQSYLEYPDLTLFPLTTGALVLLTNIQNLTEILTPLILSRETTVGIFSGTIQYWDDPSIIADNTGNSDVVSRLPHQPIQIVVPSRSSTTVVFTRALGKFSSSWNDTFVVWPDYITDNWILPPVEASNSFSVLNKVLSLNNTISYVPYSIALFVQATYAKMINKAGKVVGADAKNQKAAQGMAKFDDRNFASLLDSSDSDAWPITTFSYGVVAAQSSGNCTEQKETLKYFIWALHDDASMIGDTLGFTRLPDYVKKMTTAILESIECRGQKLLTYEYQDQHDSNIPTAIFWINMILFAATIVIGISMTRLGGFATKILAIYTGLVLAGAILSYVSAIFWYLVPKHNWICGCRWWLSMMGFTLLLAAMFARTWQFFKVYNTIEVRGKLTSKVFGWFEYTGGIGLVAGVQLLILIIKQAVDPWEAAMTVTDDIQYEAIWRCNSTYDTFWVYLEVSFFSVLLLFGLYVVYRTWSWDGMRTESRWLLISIYNVIFVGLSVQLLAVKDSDMTDDSLVLYAQIMIAVIASNLVSAVVVPMFFASLWKKIQTTFTTVSVTELDLQDSPKYSSPSNNLVSSGSSLPTYNNESNASFTNSNGTTPTTSPPPPKPTPPLAYFATPNNRKTQSAMEPVTERSPTFSPGFKSEIVQRKPN